MELSKRLQAVVQLLDCHERVADIGCDHGFVSIYLIESGKASWCLAMDVNKGPLGRARDHVIEKRLSTYIETRLSDGAKEIRYIEDENRQKQLEVEAALIAGMGGRLMIQILTESLSKFQSMEEFVLQPQSEIAKVRHFIREMGYHIAKEDMVLEDGKYYPMMKVVRGKKDTDFITRIPKMIEERYVDEEERKAKMQELYDEYGEYLLRERHTILFQFLKKENEIYQDILKSLMDKDTKKSELRQKEIMERIEFINLGLEWFKDEM